jgi:hypothetical protein
MLLLTAEAISALDCCAGTMTPYAFAKVVPSLHMNNLKAFVTRMTANMPGILLPIALVFISAAFTPVAHAQDAS